MNSLYIRFLAVFTAITVLTGALIGIINYYECESVLKQQFSNSLLDGAHTINNMIGDRVGAAVKIIRDISRKDFLRSADTAKIQSYIESAAELSNFFYNIYYFTPEGKLTAAAYSDRRDVKTYLGLNFNNFKNDANMSNIHASIARAIELKSPLFSGFFYSKAKKLLFTFIVPVMENGRITGILSAAIYANDRNFQSFLNALKSHPDQFISLFDTEKGLIGATGNAPPGIQKDLAGLESEKASWETGAAAGGAGLIISVKEPMTGVLTVVGIKGEAVSRLLTTLRDKIFLYAILCMIAVIFISFIFARTLIKPLVLLISGLKSVGEGIYSHKIEYKTGGEIEEAISAFNKMNEKLYKTRVIENIWNEHWQ
ncbi:MAG TPA: cache and HAMP domain-containing protein [Candidatus Wallbacteria bacterium]|nr:cache and HAMP domain-containing protein [Candidatus Wallbacteria bacterium]